MKNIDFQSIAESALAHTDILLSTWLPGGRRQGDEYVVRNPTRTDNNPGSFRINTRTGTWADFATDDKGGDLIDLYGYLNGCSTVDAARAVSDACGCMPVLPDKPRPESQQWVRIVPVPADVPPIPTERRIPPATDGGEWQRYPIQHRWEYRAADGGLIGFVCRYQTERGKETPPLTLWRDINGTVRWRWKSLPEPRPLYNLVAALKNPVAIVVIVEGEKCAEILQGMIDSAGAGGVAAAVTWPGGCKPVSRADWKLLAGRRCVLWPDADKPGTECMQTLAAILAGHKCEVRIISVEPDRPQGWDVADAVLDEGWTWPQIQAYIKTRSQPYTGQAVEPVQKKPAPAAESQPQAPFKCLGFDHGIYYYMPYGTNQITVIAGQQHNKAALKMLAPLSWWEREYPGERGAAWDYAGDMMMRYCEQRGPYDPLRVLRKGAVLDAGRLVVSLGNRLLVDGKPLKFADIQSDNCWESASPIRQPDCDPLTTREAAQLLDICKRLAWDNPLSAYYLAGWISVAVICGALKWRPHIWLTGPRGCGKSWIIENIVSRVLGGFALFFTGASSEAGIRQRLGRDSLAVIHDESEGDTDRTSDSLQRELELARQASSDTAGEIAKGSQTGHAVAYRIRSAFCFGSIADNLTRAADQSRVTVLTLRAQGDVDPIERERHFQALSADVSKILTDDWCARFRARVIKLGKTIIQNAETFAGAGAEILGSRRSGDQVGAMLAGAFSLTSETRIENGAAKSWLSKQDLSDERAGIVDMDARTCLDMILQAQIQIDGGGRRRPIAELLLGANLNCRTIESGPQPDGDEANLILSRHGIKFRVDGESVSPSAWWVCISDSHREIGGMLKGTPFARSWKTYLRRVPGARHRAGVWFAGSTMRTTEIPWAECFR